MVSPSRLAHIVFRTDQMKRMILWYQTVLAGALYLRATTSRF